MPRLHQYRNQDDCYFRTSIRGTVITFQLTPEGQQKLKEAGVAPEQKFPRALLLDLFRTGDAFTGGSGVGEPVPELENQLELDFPKDPDPEKLFPRCDDCGDLEDLHLSLIREDGALCAKLQCAHHRDVTSHLLDTCIPLRLVNLSLFARVFVIKFVAKKYGSVVTYEDLLRAQFESKWEELRKRGRASQPALFQSGLAGELDLTKAKIRSE
jgi:hypothetical protein